MWARSELFAAVSVDWCHFRGEAPIDVMRSVNKLESLLDSVRFPFGRWIVAEKDIHEIVCVLLVDKRSNPQADELVEIANTRTTNASLTRSTNGCWTPRLPGFRSFTARRTDRQAST